MLLHSTTGKMKFDVIVGNPPYQDNTKLAGKKLGGRVPLWTKFVDLSFDLLIEDGWLCYVHPALWRIYGGNKAKILEEKNMIHLDIHNEDQGGNTFGVATRYDWHITQNCDYKGKTHVVGEDGSEIDMDHREWAFIPNMEFELIKSLFHNGNNGVEILHSHSAYETRSEHTQREESSNDFCYPCVYYIPRGKPISLFWSNTNERGHFGIPKVIFPSGNYKSVDCIVDKDGEYGMTQFCKAVVDDVENLDNIYTAMRSDRFIKVAKAIGVSKRELCHKALSCFRKDFWKEFINEV